LLGGLAMIAKAISAEDGFDWQMFMAGWTVVSGALAVFGIGKKIERKG